MKNLILIFLAVAAITATAQNDTIKQGSSGYDLHYSTIEAHIYLKNDSASQGNFQFLKNVYAGEVFKANKGQKTIDIDTNFIKLYKPLVNSTLNSAEVVTTVSEGVTKTPIKIIYHYGVVNYTTVYYSLDEVSPNGQSSMNLGSEIETLPSEFTTTLGGVFLNPNVLGAISLTYQVDAGNMIKWANESTVFYGLPDSTIIQSITIP